MRATWKPYESREIEKKSISHIFQFKFQGSVFNILEPIEDHTKYITYYIFGHMRLQ